MNDDLIQFLIYYNLNRRHDSLRKELDVRTPFQAVQKWFILNLKYLNASPKYLKIK
ncbi:MAG: hypothetical protein ACK5L5_10090 [Bacteroidales bacterium]